MNGNNEQSVVAIHQADEHVVVENKTVVASLKDLPVKVMVEIAHAEMTFDDISKVKVGECLTLDMIPGAAIRLLVSGCIIGYGELVKLEDRVAVRITQLF